MQAMSSPTVVIVPGWANSGAGHWQTLLEQTLPGSVRVRMADWECRQRHVWVQAITDTILAQAHPVVVVAHSLGCIATSHLPSEVSRHIVGALLVAPADPDKKSFLTDFSPVPHHKLPYRSLVVGSSNDPFCTGRLSSAFARSWGSQYLRLPAAGHINIDSGFGAWPMGRMLLDSLLQAAVPAASTDLLTPDYV